jgi:drug/metabolite transporter (DMT)-like permease
MHSSPIRSANAADDYPLENPNSPRVYPDGGPRQRRATDDDDNDDNMSFTGTIHSCADSAISGIITSISHWKIILFGQLMAVFMATRGSTASYMEVQCGVLAPAFQVSLVYGLFFLHFIYFACKQRRDLRKAMLPASTTVANASQLQRVHESHGRYKLPCTRVQLKTPWWKYLLFAFLDVQANYFTYLALKYSSIKSVTLLDTLAIPAAMISSRLVLRRQYSWTHIIGACVCVFGSTVTVFSDYEDEDSGAGYPHAVYGDILAAIGGIFYGLSDTVAEEALKESGNAEFLGMLGLFGSVISVVQVLLWERPAVYDLFHASECSKGVTIGVMVGIVASFYAFYVGLGRFLIVSEAALLNLSLLTADLWAVIFSVIDENQYPTGLFVGSMIIIMLGVLIYESVPSPMDFEFISRHGPSREEAKREEECGDAIELPPSFRLT